MSNCQKVIFIFPHLESPPFDQRRKERINRERSAVLNLRKRGWFSELFRLTFDRKITTEDDEVAASLFPVDNPETGSKHTYVSTSLLKTIEKEQPDLLIFKGIGYRLSYWLVFHYSKPVRFAFISAGTKKDSLAAASDYILAETRHQLNVCFPKKYQQGRASILPKLLSTHAFQEAQEKEFDIINVGKIDRNKRQDILLPLAQDHKIAIIGDGPLYPEIKRQAEPYADNVYMPGNVSREEVGPLIARSRLMVHPARHEGLPRAVMESFAAGVPVVASCRTMPEAFEHGVHGLLVEPEEIIPAARELLNDDARLKEMGENARKYAEEHCTKEAVFREVERMLDTVFSTPPVCTGIKRKLLKLKIKTKPVHTSAIKYFKRNLKRAFKAARLKS